MKMRFNTSNEAFQSFANDIAATQRAITILAHALNRAKIIDIEALAQILENYQIDGDDAGVRESTLRLCEGFRITPSGWTPDVIDGGRG